MKPNVELPERFSPYAQRVCSQHRRGLPDGTTRRGRTRGVPLDTTALVHLITSYGYPALAALLLVAAVGVPLPFPITTTVIVLGALSARPDGPNFLALALVATL